jgi:hypothetical protein
MNRLDQIIGRAVRNFSHKDLPFNKRNVQIFMYGTILGDENMEEAADLYVYRAAEYKAVQIGKVSRVLKESAVDCIINHEQTNFTQANMEKILDEKIEQRLSTGMVIDDFKVGDVPYSSTCDYMPNCAYKCKPNAAAVVLNEDTYNEKYISVNSDKIIQKIRMLMKENFFYKKGGLIDLIQRPKEYPIAHIYYALTRLIEDNNEFIVDKYGKNGRLINIGDYYLFQPIELRDKNISIYDRSVPMDFKRDAVELVFNTNTASVEENNQHVNGKRVLHEIDDNIDTVKSYKEKPNVERGSDNWYKHLGVMWNLLVQEEPGISENMMKLLISHEIEILQFQDKLDLMNYIYSMDTLRENSHEMMIKNYFVKHTIKTKLVSAMIMYDLIKLKMMILNSDNKWVDAQPEDIRKFNDDAGAKEILTLRNSEYKDLIGYIGYASKKNNNLVFKTKLIASDRDTGAACVQSGREKIKDRLNMISDGLYDILIKEKNKIPDIQLCIATEFLMRYYNETRKNADKKSFLTPEMAIHYKFYK